MKIKQVLVVYKAPSDAADNVSIAKTEQQMRRERHDHTLKAVMMAAEKLGITAKPIERKHLRPGLIGDLLITVGGDGTVMAAAHVAGSIPVLGVNSMPGISTGFYCAATAKTIERVLRRIIVGEMRPKKLPLMVASIDGRPIPFPALNDVLFASNSPAESVYYDLKVGKRCESQRGSGVWIAAGPGSTAGIFSAGGKAMPLNSDRLQFLVREPCPHRGQRYRLLRGFALRATTVSIISHSPGSMVYVDGTAFMQALSPEQRIDVQVMPKALRLFR